MLFGYTAGNAITTAGKSIVIGSEAGHAIQTADGAIAIGYKSLGFGTAAPGTVVGSIAIGHEALYNIESGAQRNIAIGEAAGRSITTGDRNIVIGDWACRTGQTVGANNIVLGSFAAENAPDFGDTVIIGYGAGDALNGANQSVIIGREAGLKFTFGTNARNFDAGKLHYGLKMVEECGLSRDDMLVV